MMMKRNDGYALSYVMVILLVLAAIAIATMTMAMQVMNNQKRTIRQMQDKYAAQGMVEQVVAQLEHASEETIGDVITSFKRSESLPDTNPYCVQLNENDSTKYRIIAIVEQTCVTADITIKKNTITETSGEGDEATETTKFIGYSVKYDSYCTETLPAQKTEVAE